MENCLLAITLGKCNKQGLGSRDFLTCRLLQSWSHFLWDRAVYLTILSFYFQRFIGEQGFLKALLWSLWLELGAGWSASWQRPETQPWATVFLLSPNVRSQSCLGGVPGILPAAPEWWVFSSEYSELTATHAPFSLLFQCLSRPTSCSNIYSLPMDKRTRSMTARSVHRSFSSKQSCR